MVPLRMMVTFLAGLSFLFMQPSVIPVYAAPADDTSKKPLQIVQQPPELPGLPPLEPLSVDSIEATIIQPFQTANIGSEVSGVIETFKFEEGQLMKQGELVAEISKRRYRLLTEKAEENLVGLKLAAALAKQQVALLSEMISFEGATRQELLKVKADMEIADNRVKQAEKDLGLANLNLEACQLKAPFTGYLAVRYKQPYETVDRLEKIFAIVDSTKVFAVTNVSVPRLKELKIGTRSDFAAASGLRFPGTVHKIGKIIDPKSKTKRVYLLIDNADGKLEVGMTGSLEVKKQDTR